METLQNWIKAGFLMFLAIASYEDIKEQKIQVRLFLVFGVLGAVMQLGRLGMEFYAASGLYETVSLWKFAGKRLTEAGLAVTIGAALLAVSVVTRGAIGKGDGWFFVVSGIYLGLDGNLLLLCGGFLCCFLGCTIVFMLGVLRSHDVRGLRLPLLPFLIPAGLGVIAL